MQIPLEELKVELGRLKAVVELVEELHGVVGSKVDDFGRCDDLSDFVFSFSHKYGKLKEFRYSGAVISIYAAWEKFIREVWFCVFHSCKAHDSKRLAIEYIDKIFDYVSRQKKEWRFENRTELIALLGKVRRVSALGNYSVDEDMFFRHFPNYRISTVKELFSFLDVQDLDKKIVEDNSFLEFIKRKDDSISDASSFDRKVFAAFSDLDNLVERRNSIAHGLRGELLLGSNEILSLIDYFIALSDGLVDALTLVVISKNFTSYSKLEVHAKFSGFLGLFKATSAIRVGSRLAYKDKHGHVKVCNVLGIMDEASTPLYLIEAGVTASLKLDHRFELDWEFVALPS